LASASTSAAPIRLPEAVALELEQWAASAAPAEACGVLVGRRTEAGTEVLAALRGRNLARASDRFELDPGELVGMDAIASEAGAELVAIWHSHPAGPAQLSARDLGVELGTWDQVVVGLAESEGERVAWFQLESGGWIERAWRSQVARPRVGSRLPIRDGAATNSRTGFMRRGGTVDVLEAG